MSDGCVYLVGAGPGDPGLMTIRGRDLLRQADAVVYDNLAARRLLDEAPGDAEMIYVGKQAAAHTLKQEQINELLVKLGSEGKQVVRLKGGDPFVFGRGGEEALALVEAGVKFEVVPGITAGIAALAYAGIPVTHRNITSSMALITGHEMPGKAESYLDYEALAGWPGTLGFYMGVKNLPKITASLIAHGKDPATPAALVRWGTTARQETVTGTLETITDVATAAGIKPPALIVVGHVVALREKISWFENRPLFGKKIVVTRARLQASRVTAQLEALGAEVIELPAIRIEAPDDSAPLDQAVSAIQAYDWIIFTSANGVDAFFGAMERAGLDARALAGVKVCVIGPGTAAKLAQFGLRKDAQPKAYKASEITETLAKIDDLNGKKILCPRADIAPKELIHDLEARGAEATDIAAYRTVGETPGQELLDDLFADRGPDWITFTSSSTVTNFVNAVGLDRLQASNAKLASIGPVTSNTIRSFDLTADIEAESHTIPGLIDALLIAQKSQE
ncbi:MAG: uroporphyrinogen-III C-methyltransferase [Phycisphaerales bacterium]|jgi:uroporphyrinogen III methyltransferase / synthase|nr:uroporphyrinogen-III C-methyltransferase [Phycisphaerales bacterium]